MISYLAIQRHFFYPLSRETRSCETRWPNSFEISAPNDLTCLFFHPTETCFARSGNRWRPTSKSKMVLDGQTKIMPDLSVCMHMYFRFGWHLVHAAYHKHLSIFLETQHKIKLWKWPCVKKKSWTHCRSIHRFWVNSASFFSLTKNKIELFHSILSVFSVQVRSLPHCQPPSRTLQPFLMSAFSKKTLQLECWRQSMRDSVYGSQTSRMWWLALNPGFTVHASTSNYLMDKFPASNNRTQLLTVCCQHGTMQAFPTSCDFCPCGGRREIKKHACSRV